MTQKDRIIELVKQNIITMEDALSLLEAGAKNGEVATQSEDIQAALTAFETPIDYHTEAEPTAEAQDGGTSQDQKQVKAEDLVAILDKKNQALTIARQRLRELEILSELDDLTPDMLAQSQDLQARIATLTDEISQIQGQIADQRSESVKAMGDQFKKIVEDTTQQVGKMAKQFTSQATKEGEQWQKSFKGKIKDLVDNFDTKSFNINVPWVKSTSHSHTFSFSGQDLADLDISILNGSLTVETHEGDSIEAETDMTFYGKETEDLVGRFVELNTIDQKDQRLIFHVQSPFTPADVKLRVPAKVYEHLTFKLVNGDLKVKGLSARTLTLDSKNGDIKAKGNTADFLQISSITGDMKVAGNHVKEADMKVITGDIRYIGAVESLVAEVMTGDVVVTLAPSQADSHLKVKSTTGDIKVALGATDNLSVSALTSNGDIKHRMTGLTSEEKGNFERQLGDDKVTIHLEARSTTGSIYLKD